MREPWDVLRSLKRYLALALPTWEVRIDDEMATEPLCILARTTPVTVRGTQFTSDLSFQARVAAFPGPQSSAEAALAACAAVEGTIITALRTGIADGFPDRVPLYDYDGLGIDEPATSLQRVQQQDYIRISGLTTNVLPDPEDKRRQTLIASWTNTWRKTARREWDTGPLAQAPGITMDPTFQGLPHTVLVEPGAEVDAAVDLP